MALPCVNCLFVLISAVVVLWAELDIDTIFPEEILEGISEIIVNAEGRRFQAPVY